MATKTTKKRMLLAKKPFTRIKSEGHGGQKEIIGAAAERPIPRDQLVRIQVTQQDFMRELDPFAHLIYDRKYYPDIWRYNEEDKQWYIEEVPRYAFAFQRIILTKHLTHLCGNDIVFELADYYDDPQMVEVLDSVRRGWNKKNMEEAWYRLARSVKATGDGAIVGYIDNGEFGWKSLSFLNGDTLYPHYSRRTGKMEVFARQYTDIDENGDTIECIDVWDNKYYYRLVSDGEGNKDTFSSALTLSNYDITGYSVETVEPHGFRKIPVAYHRDDYGPCWTFSQENIDNYEMAFSRLAQSNHDFGLPIAYVKGEGAKELTAADMSYASKVFVLPSDGEAGFLNRQDASNAYKAELEILEDNIYRQSFAVRTPELKSGDTPGVAIKMLYSDAYENAINDSQLYHHAIGELYEMFVWGYGIETEKRLDFTNTDISYYISPYFHVNETERANILALAVQNKFCSHQTAAEKFSQSVPQEVNRLEREKRHEQEMELMLEEQRLEIQQENTVETQEQLSEINAEQQIAVAQAQADIEDGKDTDKARKISKIRRGAVATGRGAGRPNKSGRTYDENRNWEGRDNWDRWNSNN